MSKGSHLLLRRRKEEQNDSKKKSMLTVGLKAIHPKPNLSQRLHAKYTRPYLLRGFT
ncbi:hypothetical protein ABND49_21405 [Paenibacillus larvae]